VNEIGERKRSRDLAGYSDTGRLYEWHACEDCGLARWVPVVGGMNAATGSVASPRCKKCWQRWVSRPTRVPPLRSGGPQIGDTAQAWQIGKAGTGSYVWHACEDCGRQRWVNRRPSYGRTFRRCYSCAQVYRHSLQIGPDNPAWKGGRTIDRWGYVLVWIPADDPMAVMLPKGKRRRQHVREHRLVMARELGRPLTRDEVVHHRNGIRSDNRIENLQLVASNREHRLLEAAITRAAKLAVVPPALRVDPGPDYAWQTSLF